MAWAESIRHVLPTGRSGEHEAAGNCGRGRVLSTVVDGITVAPAAEDEKPEEEPHDDF
jgi:hypothetical protein